VNDSVDRWRLVLCASVLAFSVVPATLECFGTVAAATASGSRMTSNALEQKAQRLQAIIEEINLDFANHWIEETNPEMPFTAGDKVQFHSDAIE
jgi:hypothetical protein